MKNPDPDTAVRRFIDGDLPDDEVQKALHYIADDAEARSLLQFELRMTQDLAASHSSQPSAAFAQITMNRLAEAEDSTSTVGSRVRSWWESLARPPVIIPVRPVSALATLVVLVGFAVLLWPSSPSSPTTVASHDANQTGPVQTATASTEPESNIVWTRFVYVDDDARSVSVAGDFSQWKPISLSPRTVSGKTVWTGLVRVRRGEHEYQYVIDGEKWVTDPLAPVKRDDGFGAQNAVLQL